jgi:hypothetical protein
MTRQTISPSGTHAANRRAPRKSTGLVFLGLLVIISLSCDFGIKPEVPISQQQAEPPLGVGFEKSDCSVDGVTFSDVTVDNFVDENLDGPYLICNSISASAHGSVEVYIGITTYKADKLEGAYQNLKTIIQGYVDQSTAWNADPVVPAEAKHEISMIMDTSEGYIFMITSQANVQNCFNGRGFGAEKVYGKYLVNIKYLSCELADTPAYVDMLERLETSALLAIERVEGANNP